MQDNVISVELLDMDSSQSPAVQENRKNQTDSTYRCGRMLLRITETSFLCSLDCIAVVHTLLLPSVIHGEFIVNTALVNSFVTANKQ